MLSRDFCTESLEMLLINFSSSCQKHIFVIGQKLLLLLFFWLNHLRFDQLELFHFLYKNIKIDEDGNWHAFAVINSS